MPKSTDPFTTVSNAYDKGGPKTVIRKGSKHGGEYAKKLQEHADTITRQSRSDLDAFEASSGVDVPSTAAGNRIARKGAASIAADEVVNEIKDKARSKNSGMAARSVNKNFGMPMSGTSNRDKYAK